MEVGKAAYDPASSTLGQPGAKGPEPEGEPSIQYVVVLAQLHAGVQFVLGAYFGFVVADIDFAAVIVPSRNTMPPTADARYTSLEYRASTRNTYFRKT